ncbi:MAG TPA: type II toxin-antitoxin system RelE/ParE family toxin [Verrucomicrobiae bacterium]|jgi:mRNA interferase RelE/StbE|nr:type II toxin-antitoxin system RelE/ParE family toxin [Verrucomicrobiae bacterium]
MGAFKVIYDEKAREDLDRLSPRNAFQIVRKIGRLQNGLQGDVKRLKGHDIAYRLRMGNFRILFDVDENTITIRKIKDRKEAYD